MMYSQFIEETGKAFVLGPAQPENPPSQTFKVAGEQEKPGGSLRLRPPGPPETCYNHRSP